jgi:hypothetical protein
MVAFLVVLGACSAELPDERLRRIVADGETAAEERNTSYFREIIAENYSDVRGNDRDRLLNTIRGVFLASNSIDVVLRVDSVNLLGDDAAEVVLEAAVLSSGPGRAIFGFDGDFYRFELGFALLEDDWKLVRADWDRVLR